MHFFGYTKDIKTTFIYFLIYVWKIFIIKRIEAMLCRCKITKILCYINENVVLGAHALVISIV